MTFGVWVRWFRSSYAYMIDTLCLASEDGF